MSVTVDQSYLDVLESYLDNMSEVQRDLLVLFSESYVASEDNFNASLSYAEDEYDGEFPEDFEFFSDFALPMKNFWRENDWRWIAAAVHTAPNAPEPFVNRSDGVERTIMDALQFWAAEERNSFYSHAPSWVAGATGFGEDVVTRVFAKVQGEMFAFDPPEKLYYVASAELPSLQTRGGVGRVVSTTVADALDYAETFSKEGESVNFSILEVVPGEETLVAPFYESMDGTASTTKYVVAFVGDAELTVEKEKVSV